MKYYIDTCVWIDFVEERTDIDIFAKCVLNEDIVMVSEMLFVELQKNSSGSKVHMIIDLLRSKALLTNVNVNREQIRESERIAAKRNVPRADALHAILTRDNDAVFVTRDKHFLMLRDLCTVLFL